MREEFIRGCKQLTTIMKFKKTILTLLIGIFLVGIASNFIDNNNINNLVNIPKTSDLYTSQIEINDISTNNWSWAKTQGYCTGMGTEGDPYIIKDDIFSVGGLVISNSIKFFEIINCTFENSVGTGLFLNNATNGKISNITAQNNNNGIYLLNSHNIEISECILKSNDAYELLVENSDWNVITKNIVLGKENGDTGIRLDGSHNNTISSNFADNFEYTCISLEFSHNNVVSRNNGTNSNCGISSHYSNDNIITDNQMFDNDWGINANHVNNHIITGNHLYQNTWAGFNSHTGVHNKFTQNNVSYNYYEGIILTSSSDTISYNDVSNNDVYGIRLQGSVSPCESVILNNHVFENVVDGIRVESGNHNINITSNLFEDNGNCGIYLNNGAMGVVVSNNSLKGNNQHAEDNGVNNYWDDDSIGNFWDNYTGTDTDDNGIGDYPYIYIDGSAESQDNCPIWEDGDDVAPLIIVLSPSNSTTFIEAPTISLFIYDYYSIDTTWYLILEENIESIFSGNTLEISSEVWNLLPAGEHTIIFYVNDTSGHVNSTKIVIIKADTKLAIPFADAHFIILLMNTTILVIILKTKKHLIFKKK